MIGPGVQGREIVTCSMYRMVSHLRINVPQKLNDVWVSFSVVEFWGDIAKEFYWKTPCPGPFLQYNFDVTKGKIFIEWMKGATTNICYNVLDRIVHEKKLGDKVAFYW